MRSLISALALGHMFLSDESEAYQGVFKAPRALRLLRKPPAGRAATPPSSALRRALAWLVHFYTALGLVAAAGVAVLIVRGEGADFGQAFLLMLVATVIDATDGTLARYVRVKEVLPGFDGRRLDDLVDFLTYAFLPLLLVWRARILPLGYEPWLLVPLLASAYGFCQVSAKTDDGYFLGFPSYWNIVAFYLYVLPITGWTALVLVLTLAVLTFVPTRYLYPSQRGRWNRLTNILGAVWGGLLTWALLSLLANEASVQSTGRVLGWISLFYPVYYMGVSWAISIHHLRCRFQPLGPVQVE